MVNAGFAFATYAYRHPPQQGAVAGYLSHVYIVSKDETDKLRHKV